MRYYIDTEFLDRGRAHPIELISLGIAAEDGRTKEYVFTDYDMNAVHKDDWLIRNVVPRLYIHDDFLFVTQDQAADDVVGFVDNKPEFWGYYADWDWVLFCRMFGRLLDTPFPNLCMDVKQLSVSMGGILLPKQTSLEHNALNDAIWTKESHEYLLGIQARQDKDIRDRINCKCRGKACECFGPA